MEFNGSKIREDINAYGLRDTLLERMAVVRVGGIAYSTFYKACDRGPITPLLRLILQTAESVIAEHLEKAAQPTELAAA